MRVMGIIPARYASTRFPGKPLIDLKGKPMIQHVFERCQMASSLHELVVATDDNRIYDVVLGFGGKAIMTSPTCHNGTERCLEVISKRPDIDVVINIQGDEPLVDPAMVDGLVNLFSDQEVVLGTMVKRSSNERDFLNQNRIKVVLDNNHNALYFSRSPIPYPIANSEKHSFLKHVGIYGYRSATLAKYRDLQATPLEGTERLEQLRWLANGYKMKVGYTEYDAISIDAPDDVEIVLNKME